MMTHSAGPTPTPVRRVTRSQSRDRDLGYSKGAPKGSSNLGASKGITDRLTAVPEERTPLSSRQHSILTYSVISGTPSTPGNAEGHSNISGTTFLNQDYADSDGEASQDPILLLDELPDLQHAASRLMNLLVSNHSDPIGIVNSAKRMRVAGLTSKDNRRLKSQCRKLVERMTQYGTQSFIDVSYIQGIIPSISASVDDQPWSSLPTLHGANCARLAFEVLLSAGDSESAKQMVESLNSHFPAPFLNQLTNARESNLVGSSAAEKAAWELALEIRTQHFIMEFARRQNDKDFDPALLLRSIFYNESNHEGAELDSRWLRGFSLATAFKDENECLPDRYHDAVLDRIGELELDFFDDDGAPNAKGLRAAFSWQRFTVRTARFLHIRDKEIRRDLKAQADFDDVHDILETKLKAGEIATDETPTQLEGISTADGSSLQSLGQDNLDPINQLSQPRGRDSSVPETDESLLESPTRESGEQSPLQGNLKRVSQVMGEKMAVSQKNRRMSGKRFLTKGNADILKRLSSNPSARPERPAVAAPATNEESTADRGHDDNFSTHDDTMDHFEFTEGLDESTTPPGSARTRNVSHPPAFSSPGPSGLRAPPLTAEVIGGSPSVPQAGEAQSVRTPQRTFIDRQKTARRVSPIDSRADSQSAERRPRPQLMDLLSQASRERQSRPQLTDLRSQASRKRPLPESDDDSSVFEVDERSPDVNAKRAAKPLRKRHAPERPERSAVGTANEAENEIEQQLPVSTTTRASSSTPARRLSMATLQRIPNESPKRVHFSGSSESPEVPVFDLTRPRAPVPSARLRTVLHTGTNQRRNSVRDSSTSTSEVPVAASAWEIRNTPPQHGGVPPGQKGKWCQAEDDRLLSLMKVYGTAWTKIISEDKLCPESAGGPILAIRNRDDQNCKDRARLLKQKFANRGPDNVPEYLRKATKPSKHRPKS
ncbi:MYB DNA-binding domain protein [Penicillium verhagenii]|nr:MYB DNA-binding domain protein [Penicillium verhagenii]